MTCDHRDAITWSLFDAHAIGASISWCPRCGALKPGGVLIGEWRDAEYAARVERERERQKRKNERRSPVRRAEQGLTFDIPPGAEVIACRSCKAPIVWVTTPAGNRMPVDFVRGESCCPPAKGVSHFATCPDAASWRKKK